MAKPLDDKDNNPNNKQPFELSPNAMMILNNAVMIIIMVILMIIMYVLLDSSFNRKIAKLAPLVDNGEYSEGEDDEKREGVLIDLGEFILNLADTQNRRYLKVGVAMELSKTPDEIAMSAQTPKAQGHGEAPVSPDSALVAVMERYKPAIRDAVISVLSNKTSDELSTPVGKEIAKEEILEMVNNIFEGQREVIRVSFGQFIIQ